MRLFLVLALLFIPEVVSAGTVYTPVTLTATATFTPQPGDAITVVAVSVPAGGLSCYNINTPYLNLVGGTNGQIVIVVNVATSGGCFYAPVINHQVFLRPTANNVPALMAVRTENGWVGLNAPAVP